MVVQLLHTVLWLPPGRAFVLIYEDSSADTTRRWLSLLQLLLAPIGVPCSIIMNGTITRGPGQSRISHLARIRNTLVDPFYPAIEQQQALCSPLPVQPPPTRSNRISSSGGTAFSRGSIRCDSEGNCGKGVGGSGEQQAGGSTGRHVATEAAYQAACFQPDEFLFLNDVAFCRDDAARLLLRRGEADMACGLDLVYPPEKDPPEQKQQQQKEEEKNAGGLAKEFFFYDWW